MTPVAECSSSTSFENHHQHHSTTMDLLKHIPNGGGGDTTDKNSTNHEAGGCISIGSSNAKQEHPLPSSNGPTQTAEQQHYVSQQQQEQQQPHHSFKATSALSKDPSQKGGIGFGLGYSYDGEILPPPPSSSFSPNELFFGGGDSESDRSSGLSYKDREERVRQMRERQQTERQQKLVELKEQAAAAQRFREQQEALRRQRLDDMRSKDSERRCQVEERKRLIQQAEQERREAVLRKSAEREHRLELKRRQERSNVVFAFGSSTPRMLDPKENLQNYFGPRRATSTTNVNLSDSSSSIRRTSEVQDTTDLSRKRATSAHSLNRKLEDGEEEVGKESLHAKPSRVADLRMSTSMYEVFNWDDSEETSPTKAPYYQPGQGTRLTKSRDSSVERRPRCSFRPRASTPDPPFRSVPMSPSASLSSSNSSDKTLIASQDGSRFSVWEFGDNFAALGPTAATSQGATKVSATGSISSSLLPLSFTASTFQHLSATAPTTPISTPHASRRTPSILTGAGSTYGGEFFFSRL